MLRSGGSFLAAVLPVCAACVSDPAPASTAAIAAHPPHTLRDTEVRSLPRSANGKDYLLYVALPRSYASDPGRRYPVLYLCDGYWDFVLVKGFYGNLLYDRVIPELIIVGLGYQGEAPDYDALRASDYTPVPERPVTTGGTPKPPGTGHAPEFLRALEGEIIPFVERAYRADPGYRVLGGSSLGGLFTLYVLLTRPALFQAYIAPSPAVSWADGWLFSEEARFAQGRTALRARLFMSGAGAESPEFLAAIQRFDGVLRGRGYPGLSYEFRLVEGERHAGTKAESYNRGVRFAFAPLAGP
jgi:predicted alpha/beta superfamily hydrolase